MADFLAKTNFWTFAEDTEKGRKKVQIRESRIRLCIKVVTVDIIWTGERERKIKQIEQLSKSFDGEFSDEEVMNALGLKHTTYYALKREIKLYRE